MAVFAKDFTFNNIALSSFSAEYCLVDFDDEDNSTALSRSFQQSSITNDNSVVYFYDAIGSALLEFDITICRKDDKDLTPANAKELSDWLMGEHIPRVAYFTSCDDEHAVYDDTDFIGGFTQSSYTQRGTTQKMGMTFHFQNISPYGFTKEVSVTTSEGTVTLENTGSRTGELIWPTITINPTAAGKVHINNLSDPSVGSFIINMKSDTPVIIEDRNVFTANGELYSFDNLDNFNWPALVDGENEILIYGAATVTITARFYKNLGV